MAPILASVLSDIVGVILTATMVAQDPGVVTTTRSGLPIDEQAVRVDVLDRDAIDTNMLVAPGDIVTLLGGMPGARAQVTSPELGTAQIRIEGLRGQYTRVRGDGLPLYFDLPGGLGLRQIPSMDLDHVELVAGGTSAFFGTNAVGGAFNLLSRLPRKDAQREFLVSQSARGGTDGTVWIASPDSGHWSRTFLAGVHHQNENDSDDDGWSDIPGYSRAVVRQGVYWNNGRGKIAGGVAHVVFETREGGSAFAHQSLESRGANGALFGEMPFKRFTLAGGMTLFAESRTRKFVDGIEHERRESSTIELELRGTSPRQHWVAGLGSDWFALRSKDPIFSAYLSTRPNVFVHDDIRVSPWLLVSASARADHHNIYGFFVSPRGSALVHRGPWAARVTADRSYFAPTGIMEDTDAAGLLRLKVDQPLEVETSRRLSADLTHKRQDSSVTFTFFTSHVDHPALIDRATYTLRSNDEPVLAHGIEISGTARRASLTMTGTYAYTRASEADGREVALTPRHRLTALGAVSSERAGRVGVQVSFTGQQRLDANPYRAVGQSYVLLTLMAERRIGRWRVFANADNLTDVRQTDWDPIARPSRDIDGRWTVDAWAPLSGRVINFGIKAAF